MIFKIKLQYILLLLSFVSIKPVSAQLFDNSWINYELSYYKIPVYQTGIHRISYQQLVNSGVNVTSIDPKTIQIFAKGKEQHIYIQGESDRVFNNTDFIEFYGEVNDGELDSQLFEDSLDQANPFVSMFSDTIFYFLTWSNNDNAKRMVAENDVSFSGYSPLAYFIDEVVEVHKNRFSSGAITSVGTALPEYTSGEGYVSNTLNYNQTQTYNLNTPHVFTGGPLANFEYKVIGSSRNNHNINASINGTLVSDENFERYNTETYRYDINSNLLNNQTEIKYKNATVQSNFVDRMNFSYTKIRYPRQFNLDGASQYLMEIPGTGNAKDLVQISNYNNNSSTVRIYDLDGHKRIIVQPIGGLYQALITSNNGLNRRCLITSESNIIQVTSLLPVSNSSTKFLNYQEISDNISGADYFIIAHPSLIDAANEYAEYRNQTGFSTLVLDIEQLYNQYSWGIRKHPFSIHSFAKKVIEDWDVDEKYLFLMGKSVAANNAKSTRWFELNMVPTWSVLGSDIGFTAGITNNTILEPEIPTGRIAAKNNEEVRNYLNKVKAHEAAPKAEWMKNILHFGGGETQNEQNAFKNYLSNYQGIAEKPSFGGKIHTFLKNSSAPLQINLSDSVTNLINQGVTVMTFFGHAYGSNFDQSIDEPENYSNTGKYPLIIANSCLIGNIHTTSTESGSERFVLAKDKGAIVFLGSSSLGVPTYLNRYTNFFYQHFADLSYGMSIGDIIKSTIKDIQDPFSELSRDVCMHMTLHGDPAIVLNAHEKPDYTVFGNAGNSQSKIFTIPQNITAEMDSFEVNVVITNIGKAQLDTFNVILTRSFPDGNKPDTIVDIVVSNIFYKDTIKVKFPVDIQNGIGLNNLSVHVDYLSFVDESDEFNNIASIPLLISGFDISPVYPYEFAVIPNYLPVLKASTGNPYSELKSYIFEIDTSEFFNSSIKVSEIIQSNGGVVEWNPSSSSALKNIFETFSQDNQLSSPNVFYWRVSVDKPELNWNSSSFQYVKDKTGWGQSHWGQFTKGDYQFIDYNNEPRKFNFIEQIKKLEVTTHADPGLRNDIKYRLDGAIICFQSKAWGNYLFVAVIDKKTLQPWHAQEHGDYGHINFQDRFLEPIWNAYNFYFNTGSVSNMDSLVSFVNDVPDSNYIFMYNFRSHRLGNWYNGTTTTGQNLKDMMSSLGSDVDSVAKYNTSYPYIFFTQKGNSSRGIDVFGENNQEFITLFQDLKNTWFDGSMFSTFIGPSGNFKSLHWETKPEEASDTAQIFLYGINEGGAETLLLDTISSSGDVIDLFNYNANQYDRLKLQYYFVDDVNRTPSLPIRWQVVHDEIPDIAINPVKLSNFIIKDSIAQGEDFIFVVAIENISSVNMPDFSSVHWVIDNQFNQKNRTYKLHKGLAPGEVIYDTITVKSELLQSQNNLWFEINPLVGDYAWVTEKHHFNNVHNQPFYVSTDKINPVLDVTFDGIRILNGDIVSPNPEIVISLNDENQFLKLDDPSLFKLFINYPSSQGDSVVLIPETEFEFIPASLPKNEARIIFRKSFPQDGIYELGILAADKSRNSSGYGDGAYDMRIKFEVISESTITQLVNFPNPFSTSTRFVFVLTGDQIPDEIRIQILTITGKVVKEINQDELGPINIGRNITQYAWDGKDQFGDPLANGVYLYRVVVKSNGEELKERSQNINNGQINSTLSNQFFKQGYGKMYLLR